MSDKSLAHLFSIRSNLEMVIYGDQIVDQQLALMQNAARCIEVLHMTSRVRISVGLASADHREMSAIADGARVSVSWLGERAILEFLERHRSHELQLPLVLNDNKRGAA